MTNRTAVLVLFGVALLPGVGRAAPKPPTLCAGVTACSAAAETTGTAAGSTGTAAPSTQGIKYHPGHYAALDGMLRASNRSTLMAEHMRQIEEDANEAEHHGDRAHEADRAWDPGRSTGRAVTWGRF